MTPRTMLWAVLPSLLLLCSACSKETEDEGGGANVTMSDAQTDMTGSFMAQWVVNRQVVDTTTVTIGADEVVVHHMPNAWLLGALPDGPLHGADAAQLPLTDGAPARWPIVSSGYSWSTLFLDEATPDATSSAGDERGVYVVWRGATAWYVELYATFSATYDVNADKWTMMWSVRRVSAQAMLSSMQAPVVQDFNPQLTLMLITTRRTR